MAEFYDVQEGADPQAREASLFAALVQALARAKADQPAWAGRLVGIDPAAITSRAALQSLPVLRKSDLAGMQRANPPFGGLNATPVGDLARLFISPGSIFDPEGHGRDWWGAARALHAAGIRRGDVVLNTFSYHLTPAGAMFESGAHALGCAVIPAGPGNTSEQLAAIAHYRPNAYIGTPDFLKILFDKAEETGQPADSLRRALVSGAAFPPSLQQEFSARGVAARQCYGTADLGIVAYEGDGPGMVVNEGVILEIVRPGTGEAMPNGEVGEVVVTRLNRDYPLFRFATGDLSCIMTEPATDGRTNHRIKGWMGRADQATKVKGMFVRPEQMAAIAHAMPELGRLRLVVTRSDEQDVMTLRAEHGAGVEGLRDRLAAKLAEVTKLKGAVEIVSPGSLPNDGKVIADER
ncbi:phenylacetate-CoA ligase [Pseudaminobacter salicylatoxidans]|uniref:Phenylacetate-CoA ligase n=1 Tax=Pseudaminobacter salicylatoxidans TaxID=93369 RepID=A0A316C9B8_PSESE|nr:AMP-binding protein [Pseudaminobacter salicylatoxidans]PWJ86389.1 phenylacetate-CoA ligase [Pseudaminobacter salicylatoxidans]